MNVNMANMLTAEQAAVGVTVAVSSHANTDEQPARQRALPS